MNTENSKANELHKFRLILADKLNLKDPNKNMALANLSVYDLWKKIKSLYNNNKFKISAPTWNDEFDLPDYFEYTIKKLETIANNSPVQIYMNKTKKRFVFKIKTGYKLELLSPETTRSLGSAKEDVDQDKDGEDVPKLESVEVVIVDCNLVNDNYQQASKVLFTFVPNKQFGQLITIAPHSLTLQNTKKQYFYPLRYGLLIKIARNLK